MIRLCLFVFVLMVVLFVVRRSGDSYRLARRASLWFCFDLFYVGWVRVVVFICALASGLLEFFY